VGSCAQSGSAAEAAIGNGDATGDAFLGCIAAGATGDGANGAAGVGLCRAATTTPPPEPGGGTGGEGPGDEPGGVAGAQAGGRSSPRGVLGALASGELPFTGLPLWAVALAGLALTGLGVLLRRLHPPALGAGT
jgi:hypothetical protein